MKVKFTNLLEVSEMLRSDPATDWESIVRGVDWIIPNVSGQIEEGIDFLEAWKDLSVRLPVHIRQQLDFGISVNSAGPGFIKAASIAAAERAASKTLNTLRTPAEIKIALNSLPGPWTPDLLVSLWRKGHLKQEHLRLTLLDVWRHLIHPSAWSIRTWRAMFRRAGFLSDGQPKPKRPLVLYRGCTPNGRRGMSWTTEQFIAEKFADYWIDVEHCQDTPGHVYRTTVKPRDVLAMIRGSMRLVPKLEFLDDGKVIHRKDTFEQVPIKPEFEVLIDARACSIKLLETAKVRRARDFKYGLRGEP